MAWNALPKSNASTYVIESERFWRPISKDAGKTGKPLVDGDWNSMNVGDLNWIFFSCCLCAAQWEEWKAICNRNLNIDETATSCRCLDCVCYCIAVHWTLSMVLSASFCFTFFNDSFGCNNKTWDFVIKVTTIKRTTHTPSTVWAMHCNSKYQQFMGVHSLYRYSNPTNCIVVLRCGSCLGTQIHFDLFALSARD